MKIGLDHASNRWHAVTDTGEVGFCSKLSGKEWDPPTKPKKPVGEGPGGKLLPEQRADYDRALRAHGRAVVSMADDRRAELCRTFGRWLQPLLLREECHIYGEEPLALQNGATTRMLGMAAGALWTVAYSVGSQAVQAGFHSVAWYWVDNAHWKKEVVGSGSADKDAIRDYVLAQQRLSDEQIAVYEAEVDLFDADCLLEYGTRRNDR